MGKGACIRRMGAVTVIYKLVVIINSNKLQYKHLNGKTNRGGGTRLRYGIFGGIEKIVSGFSRG